MMPIVEGARPAIRLRYFPPAPDLRQYVSAYYIFRADLPLVRDLLRADLGQIRFMIAGGGDYSFAGGKVVGTPQVALIGPTMTASRFDGIGPLDVVGVALLPAGWAALVQEDASDLSDTVSDAVGVLGGLLQDGLEALGNARSAQQRLSMADALMRALLGRCAEPPYWFTRLADQWLVGDLSPRVDALVEESGLSARQVERLARRIYGAPPKLLARKYRALRISSMLSAGDLAWSDIVGDAFYDQSHFIRDFKRFTGMTPTQFRNAPPPVLRLTTSRRLLKDRLPPLSAMS
jgi:AraC-like DNA-binding protein